MSSEEESFEGYLEKIEDFSLNGIFDKAKKLALEDVCEEIDVNGYITQPEALDYINEKIKEIEEPLSDELKIKEDVVLDKINEYFNELEDSEDIVCEALNDPYSDVLGTECIYGKDKEKMFGALKEDIGEYDG